MSKKNKDLKFFLNKCVKFIYKILIIEEGVESDLSDTFVLQLNDDSLIQIIIDYEMFVYELPKKDNIIILGDYDLKKSTTKLILIKEIDGNQEIKSIYNYKQSTYHFGSKFLTIDNQFIFGFCFGWDEITLINEKKFISMLELYEDKIETIIN